MKKIFVVAPAFYKSGGPELLHQFVFEANNIVEGIASIAYIKNGKKNLEESTHPEFKKYLNNGESCFFENIADTADSIVIIPEVMTNLAKKFKYANVYIWWLSVDFYFSSRTLLQKIIWRNKLPKFLNNVKHLSQCEYISDFLRKRDISSQKISDYINDEFISKYNLSFKNNVVLYNPRKGFEFTKMLIESNPDITFKPLIKMTTSEMAKNMGSSKVYIDFGNHPGKDRMPREAALSGCIVIVGNRGSANFSEDMPIPAKYKFKNDNSEIARISSMIRTSFVDYDTLSLDFKFYKDSIKAEKENFVHEIEAFISNFNN